MQNLNKYTIPFLPSLGEQSSAILKKQILGNRANMAGVYSLAAGEKSLEIPSHLHKKALT